MVTTWQGLRWRFHEHCESAKAEQPMIVLVQVWECNGRVIYNTDRRLVESPDVGKKHRKIDVFA
jgi:hypothetical protein